MTEKTRAFIFKDQRLKTLANRLLSYRISYRLSTFILIILFRCADHDAPTEHLVFRYNESKGISTLDPAFAKDLPIINAVHQVFNGLVQMDDQLNTNPCIAKDWAISDDALTYTFRLRNDVFFHKHELFGKDSTRTVKAHDFVYSFNRLADQQVASPGKWVLNYVDHYRALNDSTFQIRLKQPFPAFLGLLTMKYCSVVPHEAVDFFGADFRSNPIGTGPFKFKRWEENIKLVFRKNEQYFETDRLDNTLPHLEAIAITFLPDKQSEFLQFIQGNLDFVSGLDDSYKDEILTDHGQLQARYQNSVQMLRSPYLNTEYLAFYMDSEVLEIQSERIRKAVNCGFDRQKMMTYLRNGVGIPAIGGMVPKGLPGYREGIGYDYIPDQSKQLIDQFKAETGIAQPTITLTTTSDYLGFCEYIQRELQKSGLSIQIDVVPGPTMREGKANGKLDAFRASWVADYPDAENYLSLFYSENFAPHGPNYTHFSSTEFDALYTASLRETNPHKRAILYAQMDSLVMAHTPVVPLFYDEVLRFTGKEVAGLGINPINLMDLKNVYKNKK